MNNGARCAFPKTWTFPSLRRLVLDGVGVDGFFKVERRLEDAFVDMLRAQPRHCHDWAVDGDVMASP
jgi:hypothetical protein